MKSPMVETASYIPLQEKEHYSELIVMKSNAGYYIGTEYFDPVAGYPQPGSRDTGYYQTREEAQEELDLLEQGKSTLQLRMSP